jgi:hypothetical protein
MNNFWRIDSSNDIEFQLMMANCNLTGPIEMLHKLRSGHGVVAANWNEEAELGYVVAMGIVESIDIVKQEATVDWRITDFQPAFGG